MAASQFQKQQEKEKEKKGVGVVDDGGLQAEADVSKEGTASETAVSVSLTVETASSFHTQSQADDRSPSSQPMAATYGYYYPGFSETTGDYYNQAYYITGNAMDPQFQVVQADNGSYVYVPGVYTGYDPYAPYVPFSPTGVDGQYAGQQIFSASHMIQSPEFSPTSLPYGTPYIWDSSYISGDGYSGVLEIPPAKPNSSTSVTSTVPYSKSSKLSNLTTNLSVDVLPGHNKKPKAINKASSNVPSYQANVPAQGYYTVAKFPFYNQGKSNFYYSNNSVNSKTHVKDYGAAEKSKARSKVNNDDDKNLTRNPVETANAAESSVTDYVASSVKRDQYNLSDFPTKYDHANFFVIKSYSEDDIHKSIKYGVWASTPNGNKRLNSAYEDAQVKMAESGCKFPVFLFFSVNASGQFCGVAEMIGKVDFTKSMDFWQQSKWNGYFPVKWHIIKDIPNSQLRHIVLENNENKPVTNSRDTQEVKFNQGIEVLNIFKKYTSHTSILDDFDFYENRQKIMQEKRLRQSVNHHDLQLKVDNLATGFQSVGLSPAKNT